MRFSLRTRLAVAALLLATPASAALAQFPIGKQPAFVDYYDGFCYYCVNAEESAALRLDGDFVNADHSSCPCRINPPIIIRPG